MALQIGDILAKRRAPCRAKIWANSREAGSFEESFFTPLKKKDRNLILSAARNLDKETRAQGKRIGPLGHIGLEVLELLTGMARRNGGRVEPSYDWIATTLKRARSAIIRAVNALVEHGFAVRVRRCTAADKNLAGPRWRQTRALLQSLE